MLRFPRFFKVCWLWMNHLRLLTNVYRWQVYRAVKYYYIVESRTVWPNLWRVVNLIHILLILAHWFGCFYFLLSEAEGFQVMGKFNYHLSNVIATWPFSKLDRGQVKSTQLMNTCSWIIAWWAYVKLIVGQTLSWSLEYAQTDDTNFRREYKHYNLSLSLSFTPF